MECLPSAAAGMQLAMIRLRAVRQKAKHHMASLTWGTSHTTQVNKATSRDRLTDRSRLWLPRRRGGKGWESAVSRGKLLQTEWINSKARQCRTGHSIQDPVINHFRQEYIAEPLDCSRNQQDTISQPHLIDFSHKLISSHPGIRIRVTT